MKNIPEDKKMALAEIEKILLSKDCETGYNALLDLLKRDPSNDHAWYLLGGLYRRQKMWAEAIDAYNHAKMISPHGPADAAIESIYDILRDSRDISGIN